MTYMEASQAELYELRHRVAKAERKLESLGYRHCDIPACNCNGYHCVKENATSDLLEACKMWIAYFQSDTPRNAQGLVRDYCCNREGGRKNTMTTEEALKPDKGEGGHGMKKKWAFMFEIMNPGDSFHVGTNNERISVMNSAANKGVKISARKEGRHIGKGFRIWKVK